MLPCTGNTIYLHCAFIKGARFGICLRKHVVAATGPSPFKVGDNQRPERTMSGVENLRLSVPSPVKNCPGEVGGINCGGDMGVRRCLARSLTSLALPRTPKSANGPRSNSFLPDSPLTTTSNRGRNTHPVPLTTPDIARSGRVLQTSVKSPIYCTVNEKTLGRE